MPVPYPEFCQERGYVFRIVHRDNVPAILADGALCRADARSAQYVTIGNPDLIEKSRTRTVPIAPGGTLEDYVRFYFTPRSMMLFNILTGWQGLTKRTPQEIAILVSSVRRLVAESATFVFTDGHAHLEPTNFYVDPRELRRIDWTILQRSDFSRSANDPGKSGRYQAELLVHRRVRMSYLLGLACFDEGAKAEYEAMTSAANLDLTIRVKPTWYPR